MEERCADNAKVLGSIPSMTNKNTYKLLYHRQIEYMSYYNLVVGSKPAVK